MKKFKRFMHYVFLYLRILIIVLIIGVIGLYGYFYFKYKPMIEEEYENILEIVKENPLEDKVYKEASIIYDVYGNKIASIGSTETRYLKFEDTPEEVWQAFVAIEERSFWDNPGFDLKGIARVCFRYILTKGSERHGASTITQQLARNIFLNNEVTLNRKTTEILYATAITNTYSKEDIIEYYINHCNYGNNLYGIETAAYTYFRKSVKQLSLSQIAYLCAIPNAPALLNPYEDSTLPLERRDKILRDMEECGYITAQQRDDAIHETITVLPALENNGITNDYMGSYAIMCTIEYFMRRDGFEFRTRFEDIQDYQTYIAGYNEAYANAKDELSQYGYSIFTSLDGIAQSRLQMEVDEVLSFDDSLNPNTGLYDLQGSATIVDNSTGKVVAIVGGRSLLTSTLSYSLNRAFQIYRQPGSSIKPLIVYAPALMNGYNANSSLMDIDIQKVKTAKSKSEIDNLKGSYVSLKTAVKYSNNGCACYLLNKIGTTYGMGFLHDMNFEKIMKSDDESVISALGGMSYGTNTMEMASAYRALAMQGNYLPSTCILSIQSSRGTELYEEPQEKQVYSPEASKEMTQIMKSVVSGGTASSMRWSSVSDVEACGKTGTTNDCKDGWFCGYTPYYTIAVYVGMMNQRKLKEWKAALIRPKSGKAGCWQCFLMKKN